MRLVLLPGMDGTGELFDPLVAALPELDCEIIPLPDTCGQDYASITEFVRARLPQEDFVLLAESFSEPIGAALAAEGLEQMKGVIFVATFLSPPSRELLFLGSRCPGAFLANLPFASYFHQYFLIGRNARRELIDQLQSIISDLPPAIIKARINTMSRLVATSATCDLPALYIQATADKLVQAHKVSDFKYRFKTFVVKKINGPHFILQAKPDACAAIILAYIAAL